MICHLRLTGDFIEPLWFRGAKDSQDWFTIQAFNQRGHLLTNNGIDDPTLEGIVLICQLMSLACHNWFGHDEVWMLNIDVFSTDPAKQRLMTLWAQDPDVAVSLFFG